MSSGIERANEGNRMRTHMQDLAITIGGAVFKHLLFHFVLTYSNVEAVTVCFSERP